MISEQLDKLGQIKLKLIMNFFDQISLSHIPVSSTIGLGLKCMTLIIWIIATMIFINQGMKLTSLGRYQLATATIFSATRGIKLLWSPKSANKINAWGNLEPC